MDLSQKPQLRQYFLQLRKALTADQVKQKSQAICKQIAALEVFQKSQHILTYYPHNNEVNLLSLLERHPEKTWYLPRLQSENQFIALSFTTLEGLEKNQYGIPEPPKASNQRYEDELDLILVPGLAFDQKGNRLGMGKGYYDRYLKPLQHTFKIGVCFAEQKVDQLPTDPYDVAVNLVIHD